MKNTKFKYFLLLPCFAIMLVVFTMLTACGDNSVPNEDNTNSVYSITYNLNEGENSSVNPNYYQQSDKNIQLQDATKYGYNFVGWYTDSKFENKITTIEVNSKKNYTLYAKWELIEFDINYYNGTSLLKTEKANLIDDYIISNSCAVDDKVVLLWHTNDTASTQYDAGDTLSFSSVENLNLYADVIGYPTKDFTFSVSGNEATITSYNGSDTIVYVPNIYVESGISYDVTSIDEACFVYGRYNDQITNIFIPEGITSIGDYAFSNCTGLTSITISNSVTDIGSYAFNNCSNLLSIAIPNSVENIGFAAFAECSNLKSLTVPFVGGSATSNQFIGYVFGADKYQDNKSIIPSSLKEITISSGSVIPYYSFYNCNFLESVSINNSVTNINSYAFYGCTNLTSVTFADNSELNSIGDYAFKDCSNLINITIPSNTTNISTFAFADCDKLVCVELPSLLSIIGESAFDNCYSLIEVINKSSLSLTLGETTYGGIAQYAKQIITDKSNSKLSQSNGVIYYIENSTSKIAVKPVGIISYIDNITLDSDCTEIYQYAFNNCENLTNIVLPSNVKVIGSFAFNECVKLSSINIPSGVTTIETMSFCHCNRLQSITIPATVTHIGVSAFAACENLINVVFESGSQLTSIESRAFVNCSSLLSISIPSSVTIIGNNAFDQCNQLTSVVFENKTGWKAGSTDISSADLSSSTIAANYLKNSYKTSDWIRS